MYISCHLKKLGLGTSYISCACPTVFTDNQLNAGQESAFLEVARKKIPELFGK